MPEKKLEETTEDSLPHAPIHPPQKKEKNRQKKTVALICDILKVQQIIQIEKGNMGNTR